MESETNTTDASVDRVVHRVNPGSDAAVAEGCKCPRMDNSYGRGYFCQDGIFVYAEGCPLHWPKGRMRPGVYDLGDGEMLAVD
jgi:hypothetical protein